MIDTINQFKRILDSIIVYFGAGIHYLIQTATLENYEIVINIIVGVLVAGFTLTKIIDWITVRMDERRKEDD